MDPADPQVLAISEFQVPPAPGYDIGAGCLVWGLGMIARLLHGITDPATTDLRRAPLLAGLHERPRLRLLRGLRRCDDGRVVLVLGRRHRCVALVPVGNGGHR